MKRTLVLYALAITVPYTPSYSLTIIPVIYILIIIEQTTNFYSLYDILLMIENAVALTAR
jgi:hypothetical protein